MWLFIAFQLELSKIAGMRDNEFHLYLQQVCLQDSIILDMGISNQAISSFLARIITNS